MSDFDFFLIYLLITQYFIKKQEQIVGTIMAICGSEVRQRQKIFEETGKSHSNNKKTEDDEIDDWYVSRNQILQWKRQRHYSKAISLAYQAKEEVKNEKASFPQSINITKTASFGSRTIITSHKACSISNVDVLQAVCSQSIGAKFPFLEAYVSELEELKRCIKELEEEYGPGSLDHLKTLFGDLKTLKKCIKALQNPLESD